MQVMPILPQAERPPASQAKAGDAEFGASMRSAETQARRSRRDDTPSRQAAETDNRASRSAPERRNADRTPSRDARVQQPDNARRSEPDPKTRTDDPTPANEPARAEADTAIAEDSKGEQTHCDALETAPAAAAAGLAVKASALWGDDPVESDPDAVDAANAVAIVPAIQPPADPAAQEAASNEEATIGLVDADPAPADIEGAAILATAAGTVGGQAETDDGPAASAVGEPLVNDPTPVTAAPVPAETAATGEDQPDIDDAVAEQAITAAAADAAAKDADQATSETDAPKTPPGIDRAAERSSGAPFQSHMPESAKPAQAALNRAPPFAAAMQTDSKAEAAKPDGKDAAEPAIADGSSESLDVDVGDVAAADKAKHDKAALGSTGAAPHPAANRPAPPPHGAQAHPITAEGAFQSITDPRGVPPTAGSDPLHLGAPSAASHAAAKSYGGEAMQPAPQQIAVNIARAAQEGADRLTVHLKPASLGKVSIHLEVGHDHRVIAVIAADRPDTFELLQRDAKALERALNDAGLRADSGSLSFDLRGQNDNRDAYNADPAGRTASFNMPDDIPAEPTLARYQSYGGDGRLDIRI